VQSFQWKFIILCPETVSRNLPVPTNLPKSSLNLPNRHKKSKWPKKFKFHWAFSCLKKALASITNLASKKPNWQPWFDVKLWRCITMLLFRNKDNDKKSPCQFRNLYLLEKEGLKWNASSSLHAWRLYSEPGSCAVWVS